MNVSIGERWEDFVDAAVKAGRYASASEIVREGLRLVEEREVRLAALRETVNASILRGGAHGDETIAVDIDAALGEWEAAGNTA